MFQKENPNQVRILEMYLNKDAYLSHLKTPHFLKYKSSKCYVTNDHNTITINYDPGSYLIYQNEWYQLTKAKIHTPSLHTINGEHYGAEIDLYHCTKTLHLCSFYITLKLYSLKLSYLNQGLFLNIYT